MLEKRSSLRGLYGVLAFGEFFDRFIAEGWQVVWIPARHKPLIANAFLIHPLGTGVDQIGLQTRP